MSSVVPKKIGSNKRKRPVGKTNARGKKTTLSLVEDVSPIEVSSASSYSDIQSPPTSPALHSKPHVHFNVQYFRSTTAQVVYVETMVACLLSWYDLPVRVREMIEDVRKGDLDSPNIYAIFEACIDLEVENRYIEVILATFEYVSAFQSFHRFIHKCMNSSTGWKHLFRHSIKQNDHGEVVPQHQQYINIEELIARRLARRHATYIREVTHSSVWNTRKNSKCKPVTLGMCGNGLYASAKEITQRERYVWRYWKESEESTTCSTLSDAAFKVINKFPKNSLFAFPPTSHYIKNASALSGFYQGYYHVLTYDEGGVFIYLAALSEPLTSAHLRIDDILMNEHATHLPRTDHRLSNETLYSAGDLDIERYITLDHAEIADL